MGRSPAPRHRIEDNESRTAHRKLMQAGLTAALQLVHRVGGPALRRRPLPGRLARRAVVVEPLAALTVLRPAFRQVGAGWGRRWRTRGCRARQLDRARGPALRVLPALLPFGAGLLLGPLSSPPGAKVYFILYTFVILSYFHTLYFVVSSWREGRRRPPSRPRRQRRIPPPPPPRPRCRSRRWAGSPPTERS